jgi:hypothetical protein
MASLPVFATVGAAYRFLVREFVTVLRLAWFPLIVVAVVQYFAAQAAFDAVATTGEDGPVASPYDLVQWVVQTVVFAIVAVSLHRLILYDDRKPGQYIAFAFGRSEMLFMVLQVLAFAGYSVVGLIFAIASGGRAMSLSEPPPLGSILSLVVILAALTCVLVRLTPLYPIAVAENRLDFRQGWELTQGKFWRLFLVFAIGMLPLGCVVAIAEGIFWSVFAQNFAGSEFSSAQGAALAKGLIIYQIGIFYVFAVLASGLGVALLCYSYKALRGLHPDALLTPEYQVRP